MFPDWALFGRSQMNFDGVGGVASLDRTEVRRVARSVTSDSTSGTVPDVTFMRYVEGNFLIPESFPTPRIAVETKREVIYVHKMHPYLVGVAEDLSTPPFLPSIDSKEMHRDAQGVSTSALRNIFLVRAGDVGGPSDITPRSRLPAGQPGRGGRELSPTGLNCAPF